MLRSNRRLSLTSDSPLLRLRRKLEARRPSLGVGGWPPAVLDARAAWYPAFPMAFAIQWTGPMGPASTRRKAPVDALKYAVELLAKGYADVVIVDLAENGKAYAPADFRDLYLDKNK